MNDVKLDSVQCVKDLVVSIAANLKFCQQCKDAASNANRMLGFINKNLSIKNRDIFLPMHVSLVRPHLLYTVNFGRTTIQKT